jgi:hypothetical protein
MHAIETISANGESIVSSKAIKKISDSLDNIERIGSDNPVSNHSRFNRIRYCPLRDEHRSYREARESVTMELSWNQLDNNN